MKRAEVEALLQWAHGLNPGPWLDHSHGVAYAAEKIAAACGMDAERAWISGALHDIGRYEGVYGIRHIFAGHRLMLERGEPELAQICLTHSFPYAALEAYMGARDATAADEEMLAGILKTPMDDYDRLIQLCDSLSWGAGVCLMEKRIVDVIRRHGITPVQEQAIRARFSILGDFQARMGHSVYALFPDAVENTFA